MQKKPNEPEHKQKPALPAFTHERTELDPTGQLHDEGDELNPAKDIIPPAPPTKSI